MLYAETFTKSIPNGTSDGEAEQFSPQSGNQWELKYLSITFASSDYQMVTYEIVDREVVKELNSLNMPANPDLIPNPGIIEAGQDYGFRFTNQSGGAIRVTVTFWYEITTPGG